MNSIDSRIGTIQFCNEVCCRRQLFGRAPGHSAERVEDFAVLRKPAGFLLAVDQGTVNLDIEDAAATLNERRLNPDLLLDCIRQTGGMWKVVSLHAILNGYLHCGCLLARYLVCQFRDPTGRQRSGRSGGPDQVLDYSLDCHGY